MIEYKESWFIKLLKFLRVIKPKEITHQQMCESVRDTCSGDCKHCAWSGLNEPISESIR